MQHAAQINASLWGFSSLLRKGDMSQDFSNSFRCSDCALTRSVEEGAGIACLYLFAFTHASHSSFISSKHQIVILALVTT